MSRRPLREARDLFVGDESDAVFGTGHTNVQLAGRLASETGNASKELGHRRGRVDQHMVDSAAFGQTKGEERKILSSPGFCGGSFVC